MVLKSKTRRCTHCGIPCMPMANSGRWNRLLRLTLSQPSGRVIWSRWDKTSFNNVRTTHRRHSNTLSSSNNGLLFFFHGLSTWSARSRLDLRSLWPVLSSFPLPPFTPSPPDHASNSPSPFAHPTTSFTSFTLFVITAFRHESSFRL